MTIGWDAFDHPSMDALITIKNIPLKSFCGSASFGSTNPAKLQTWQFTSTSMIFNNECNLVRPNCLKYWLFSNVDFSGKNTDKNGISVSICSSNETPLLNYRRKQIATAKRNLYIGLRFDVIIRRFPSAGEWQIFKERSWDNFSQGLSWLTCFL